MPATIDVFSDLDMTAVAHRLRAVREQRRMTQSRLALYADLSISYVNDIERGRSQGLPAPTLYKLCMVLGVSADYVLGLSQECRTPVDH